jgi:hypothetical protein
MVQNFVAQAIRRSRFVHPCITIYCGWQDQGLVGNWRFKGTVCGNNTPYGLI